MSKIIAKIVWLIMITIFQYLSIKKNAMMKNFTLLILLIISVVFTGGVKKASSQTLEPIETIMDKTIASGNLPDFINDAGATRGAGMNRQHVFVASRQGGGDFVYYWDINNPDAEAELLDMTDVGGGTFTLADLTVVDEHIFVSNMVFSGGFKVYHWDGVDSQPSVLINYDSPVRLGDAISVVGDPDDFATLIASGHGVAEYYVWEIENGALVSEEPEVIPLEALEENTNFSRITEVPLQEGEEERYLVSGPGYGPFLIDENTIYTEGLPADFFPGWAMYAHVFYYQDVRYLAYMHVRGIPDEEQNTLYILDLNDGATVDEAFVNLSAATFEEKVIHSVDIGTVFNGNASVSVDMAHDIHGNLMIFGFAAGNGFVVEKIGDAVAGFYTLPFVENFEGTGETTPEDWIPEDWLNVDADGDTETWVWEDYEDTGNDIYETFMVSYSHTDETEALTPDNWLVTPQIYLEPSGADEHVNLLFHITTIASTPEFRTETYQVLISETDTDPDSFSVLWEETFTEEDEDWVWIPRNIDLSDYEGSAVYLAFRHYDSTDLYGIAIEKVEVSAVPDTPEPVLADLTLNVKMSVWAELGKFDPENDFVDVAGDFNEWGENELVLTPLDDEELTYTITIPDLYVDSVYDFKFRINGSWDDETAEFPEGGPNRSVTIVEGENEYTYWYNDDLPSSVVDADQLSVSVFPNPSTGYFTLTAQKKINHLVVRDLTGREVLKKNVDDFEIIVSTRSLQNGIYLLDVYSDEGFSVQKIQVVK